MGLIQRSFVILALTLAAALPGPVSAQPFDLTGTWAGKMNCKGFSGPLVKLKLTGDVEITHDVVEDLLRAELSFGGGGGLGFDFDSCGFAIENRTSRGGGGRSPEAESRRSSRSSPWISRRS